MAVANVRPYDIDDLLSVSWSRQWEHALDQLLLCGIADPYKLLIPMNRTLRVIGGQAHGRIAATSTTEKSIYIGIQRYDIRTLTYRTPNATFTETALVYGQLNERQALEALVKLPLPALPVVPNFKSFSIDDSSAIDEVRYDAKQRILEVDLAGSGTYRYEGPTPYLVGEFLFAESKGSFFNSNIKGKFASTKIS